MSGQGQPEQQQDIRKMIGKPKILFVLGRFFHF